MGYDPNTVWPGETDEQLMVVSQNEMKRFHDGYAAKSSKFIQDWMIFKFVDTFLPLFSLRYRKAKENHTNDWIFSTGSVHTEPSDSPIEDRCTDILRSNAGWILIAPYAKKYLTDDDENLFETMSQNIKTEFIN